MRKPQLLASLAVAALLAAAPVGLVSPLAVTATQAQELRVSFSVFYNDLRQHGVWVKHAKYRYVFCPRVDNRWRPYTNGRWLYLRDRGWYFESREPFAWAVYHYGRWIDDERIGWCWVPGRHWAPAWVSWRRSNQYVGWAPLPPEGDGFQVNITVNISEPPERDWVFVPVRSFVEPQLNVNIILADRDPQVYRETEYVGPVVVENNTVINNVINLNFIEQNTNDNVEIVEAKEVSDPQAAAGAVEGATVPIFAPTIEEPTPEETPPEAVEPEQAAQELGRPEEQPAADEEQPATGQETPPADGTAPTDQSAPSDEASPADEASPTNEATPADCPDGQALVDGKCAPATTEEQTPAEDTTPSDDATPADQTAPSDATAPADEQATPTEDAVPADKAAPAAEQAPADDGVTCPEGQQLVDGNCVPVAGSDEQQAPAQEESAPAEQEAAPARDEQAAPAEEAAPAEQPAPAEEAAPAQEQQSTPEQGACPEGFRIVDGQCVPIEGAAE